MNLKGLGPYRIERTEEYDQCLDSDKSYCEMIRVRGSKPQAQAFMVPSHLYKYSDTELALYLKDRKNTWRALGKMLNEDIDISDQEIILVFPVSMFRKIAELVPFVRKSVRKKPMSEQERSEMLERLSKARAKRLSQMKQNDSNLDETQTGGNITLEAWK